MIERDEFGRFVFGDILDPYRPRSVEDDDTDVW